MENISFYCVNFKNESRRQRMTDRFEKLNIPLNFVPGVELDDPRVCFDYVTDKRTACIMLQHVDSLRHFIENSTNNYCIVCEDDILISKNLKTDLAEFIEIYENLSLNVLLLGYLVSFKIEDWFSSFVVKASTDKYKYTTFPDDVWGSQMYLVSRKNAIDMVQRYTHEFMRDTPQIPFNPDWTLTKYGSRLLVNPMVAVEEGTTQIGDNAHNEFHARCYQANFNSNIHF